MAEITLEETGRQPYSDTTFSAGLVDGHPVDTIYLKLERPPEEPTVLIFREDEALAILWLLSGALWSKSISRKVADDEAKPLAEITITQSIVVDAEIADEIHWLNKQGVRTEGCCSGHGEARPTAMIKPSSVTRARELGYAPWHMENLGLYEIKLLGDQWPIRRSDGYEFCMVCGTAIGAD